VLAVSGSLRGHRSLWWGAPPGQGGRRASVRRGRHGTTGGRRHRSCHDTTGGTIVTRFVEPGRARYDGSQVMTSGELRSTVAPDGQMPIVPGDRNAIKSAPPLACGDREAAFDA